jgi:hypothetical protein
MTDPVAKRDFSKVQIALIRRQHFGADVEVPELDGPVPLFDDDDDLADALNRHPANGPEEAA